jgi:predicted metal-binding protein
VVNPAIYKGKRDMLRPELSEAEMELEPYLKFLCRRAKELGASEAVALPATAIVIDERTRLKCLVPLCASYGRSLVCPPNVMPVAEFKHILESYHRAILVRVDAALSEPPRELTDKNSLSEVWEMVESTRKGSKQPQVIGNEYILALRNSQESILGIINQIESLCITEGYSFATGLGAGTCWLCEECVGPASGLPCRHPFKARPSMEAMGIDVVATAKKAGVQVNFTPNGTRNWLGLILVD